MTSPHPPSHAALGRVLIIAGSDSGGGAGVQADIKAITMLGGFAMTAITATTAQNTLGVTAVEPVSAQMIRAQIDAVMGDLGADAIKIGMLGDQGTIVVVDEALTRWAGEIPVVLDPVMIAKGGHPLLAHSAVATLKEKLLPRAALVTPNAPEAAALAGMAGVETLADQREAGARLLAAGARAVLVKGGHRTGPIVQDLLVSAAGEIVLESPRIETRATHGTGCTLASAIAARLAQGANLETAVRDARDYLMCAIRAAPGFGAGHGPLGHNWALPPKA